MPQSFAELLASKDSNHALASWNGMQVFAIDLQTNDVLVNAGENTPHDPASLTKMMTFYLALKAMEEKKTNPNDMVTISSEAAHQHYARVKAGQKFKLSELLTIMMTASDNGAAVAVAEQLGKDPVTLMNTTAQTLGLKHTHFSNVNGLPVHRHQAQNTVSAGDMAALLQRIHTDFPNEAETYMGQSSVTYEHHVEPAHHFLNGGNKPGLELPEGYHALAKTGYTEQAGHNIATIVTGPDKHQLLVVVLGGRWDSPELAREAGVPDSLMHAEKPSSHKAHGDHADAHRHPTSPDDIKGNVVRDALVKKLTEQLIGSPEKEKDTFIAPQMAVIHGLPVSALKAVAACALPSKVQGCAGAEAGAEITVLPGTTAVKSRLVTSAGPLHF